MLPRRHDLTACELPSRVQTRADMFDGMRYNGRMELQRTVSSEGTVNAYQIYKLSL